MATKKLGDGKITVLLLNEGGRWVLQCLEHDIAQGGNTIAQTFERFGVVMEAYVADHEQRGLEPLQDLPAAPREYWQMLEGYPGGDDG